MKCTYRNVKEYSGGENNRGGRLKTMSFLRGFLSFMIVGLKENVPLCYQISSRGKNKWKIDKRADFRLIGNFERLWFQGLERIVSDNHSANVLAYKLLLEESGQSADDLFIEYDHQKIYLLHDGVHLIN